MSNGNADILSRLDAMDGTLTSIKKASTTAGGKGAPLVPPAQPYRVEDNLRNALGDLFDRKIRSYKVFYAKYPDVSMEISDLTQEVMGVGVGRCTLTVTVKSAAGKFMNLQTIRGQATTTKSDTLDIADIACGNAVEEVVRQVRSPV